MPAHAGIQKSFDITGFRRSPERRCGTIGKIKKLFTRPSLKVSIDAWQLLLAQKGFWIMSIMPHPIMPTIDHIMTTFSMP
jgi:hypothetical protein